MASTCRGCGHEVNPLSNWCSVCGADLRSSVLVLDGEADGRRPEVEVESQPVRWRVAGGVLLALAAVIGVASFTGGRSDPLADDEVAVEEDAVAPDEADPEPADDPVGGEAEEEPPIDVDEVLSEMDGDDGTSDHEEAADEDAGATPDGPLLDRVTGLRLLVMGGGADTKLIDMDSGRLEEFDLRANSFQDSYGPPRGALVLDDRVLSAGAEGSVLIRPLDDLEAEPVEVRVFEGRLDGVSVAPSSSPGHFWVLGAVWGDNRQELWLVEVDLDGSTVAAPQLFESVGYYPTVLGPDGLVVWSPDGMRLMGREGIEVWPHGQPTAFGPGVSLALVCDQALSCGSAFVDLETGERTQASLDGFGVYEVGFGSFSPDGRFYAAFDWGSSGLVVLDVARGTPVATFRSGTGGEPARPSWSPDGRYIAWVAASAAHVGEVETGEVTQLPHEVTGHLFDSWSVSLVFLAEAG